MLNKIIKGKILALYELNWTIKDIADHLNTPKSTIGDFLRKFKKYGTIDRIPGSGRPKKLQKTDVEILLHLVECDPKKSSNTLRNEINHLTGKSVFRKTIGNYLNSNFLFGRVCQRKPLLSKKNIIKRYELSKILIRMNNDAWKTIIFSDEASFQIFLLKKGNTVIEKKVHVMN
ncbi:uncharacterized protein LOC118761107 [Octopus sinensis]|uniref:Uncharacterized protein LOC118761107 n=1 Tax=Octopus sinensis TaxID=2607531 RepID=A0A7E6EI69_9MOLL|nr:uncharacterized protein LOC118761107 [Octopus sinensis]